MNLSLNPGAGSFVDTIRANAEILAGETAVVELSDGEHESARMSWGDLDCRARLVASVLCGRASAGDRMLLIFQSSISFLPAFLGCLYAGMVAVPAPAYRRNQNAARLQGIAADSGARLALVQAPENLTLDIPIVPVDYSASEDDFSPVPLKPEDPAFLQYTSGSTGVPRGVLISHANITHNLACIHKAYGMSRQSVVVTWLPFHHDMGLISALLFPLSGAGRIFSMPPAAFLQRPLRWLSAITKYKGTHTGAPNFAYDLCIRTTTDEARKELDLSSWSVACNGGEPVREETLRRFCETFGPCGFRSSTFFPSYGLAESTVLVNVRDVFTGDVRIVDPAAAKELPEGEEGEIWVSGPSVANGYWGRPEETETTFRAHLAGGRSSPYLRTGDLGRFLDGKLVVSGRLKDLIIVRGVNHYPQDIEETASRCHEALDAGNAAAFSIESDGEERLVIAVEISREFWRNFDAEAVLQAIRRAVTEAHNVQVQAIAVLRPHSLPKTTSGKIQRGACRAAFLADELRTLAAWQFAAEKQSGTGSGLEQWLAGRVAAIAGLPADEVDPHRPFADYALDSNDAVRLSGEIEERLGRRMSPTIAYDYPTAAALARYLRGIKDAEALRRAGPSDYFREPVAVVGMACRFPGAANPEAFRQMLLEGRDAVTEIPPSRWDVARYYDAEPAVGSMYTRRGAFLAQVDGFDAEFFNITPREAGALDPQQRLWLEVAWEAIEDAGQSPLLLAGTRTGVFAGQCFDDYMSLSLARGAAGIDAYTGLGSSRPASAGRLSYFLGLHGPAIHVDTSCSSSAVSVHLACQSLRSGECDLALAGGVNLILAPESTVALCQLRALAPDGRSKTFDASADGYGRGEGCGVVVLKRLCDAISAGDRIEAVIRGSAVNHDGHTNGFTAPSAPAQAALIRQALAVAQIAPQEVGYVEAHGTGTLLGDPIEIGALATVFGDRPSDRPLLVGSVKTNIGHLEGSAGIAGLIKAVLAVRDGEIAPHLHLNRPNPHIDWEKLALQVPVARTVFPAWAQRRIAGVSSFGMSGTNAHIVVENAPSVPERKSHPESAPQLLTLSARNAAALRELMQQFSRYLGKGGNLADICYTANAGRAHFSHRIAAVANSVDGMRSALDKAEIREVAGAGPTVPDAAYSEPGRLAQLYLQGAEVDWLRLYRGSGCRKLSLPTYPFQRRSYWIGTEKIKARVPPTPRLLGKRIKPAGHAEDDHVWETEMNSEQFAYLSGHRIHGHALMPVAAYIEMARTAVGEALGATVLKVADLQLHHPLMLPEEGGRTIQLRVARSGLDTSFFAYSRPDSSTPWVLHATAKVRRDA
jgi:acyl-CoA synthetase (AMP-forming)/AMP-acid ligase II/3-oxoacyl-(acyl-carrier-protein) synthase/acyl carrier protein